MVKFTIGSIIAIISFLVGFYQNQHLTIQTKIKPFILNVICIILFIIFSLASITLIIGKYKTIPFFIYTTALSVVNIAIIFLFKSISFHTMDDIYAQVQYNYKKYAVLSEFRDYLKLGEENKFIFVPKKEIYNGKCVFTIENNNKLSKTNYIFKHLWIKLFFCIFTSIIIYVAKTQCHFLNLI